MNNIVSLKVKSIAIKKVIGGKSAGNFIMLLRIDKG